MRQKISLQPRNHRLFVVMVFIISKTFTLSCSAFTSLSSSRDKRKDIFRSHQDNEECIRRIKLDAFNNNYTTEGGSIGNDHLNNHRPQVVIPPSSSSSTGVVATAGVRSSRNNADDDFYYYSGLNDHRYSTSDWLHSIYSIRRSSILRSIKSPVIGITIWSIFISMIHRIIQQLLLVSSSSIIIRNNILCIARTPHSFASTAVGSLLVFRTNSAYQRFSEGRRVWEKILSTSRNLTRLTTLYEANVGTERKLRIFRYLAVFPYLLHDHILDELDNNDADMTTKPTTLTTTTYTKSQYIHKNDSSPSSSSFPLCLFPLNIRNQCIKSNNSPIFICNQLSKEIYDIQYNENFTSQERFTFLSYIDTLSQCVGECERIHQTSIPQNYARHALRSLTLWLCSMPFALLNDFGLLTGPVMCVTAWLMFGTYQIGKSIEDPFQGSIRLRMLCDGIYRDVMMYGE